MAEIPKQVTLQHNSKYGAMQWEWTVKILEEPQFPSSGARIVRSGTFAKVRGRKALTRSCLSNSLEQDRGRWRPGLPGLKVRHLRVHLTAEVKTRGVTLGSCHCRPHWTYASTEFELYSNVTDSQLVLAKNELYLADCDSKESNKRDVLSVLLGIVGRAGIVVLACTNFLHQLDDAMVRPGRLEKWIPVLPFSFEERLNFFAEKVLSVFDGAGKGLCRPSGWSVADLMDSTVADLDLLRRKSGILMAKVNESGMSQAELNKNFCDLMQEERAKSRMKLPPHQTRLDFLGIFICQVFLAQAEHLIFDLCKGA
ncbi:unnamed protein product [Durusdinium trenchii]|uniref:ATPase AAA-type core domain-containing protein n=1 Tax=Durusdinium trenchii TaxID=1381693 RepID=A0ABP0SKI3_9DINO